MPPGTLTSGGTEAAGDTVERFDYEREARAYARHRHRYAHVLDELRAFAGTTQDSRTLEVGCGHAAHLGALARESGCRTVGLDPSAAMLRHATDVGLRMALVQGAAESLPFADGSFDLVFSVNAIHHMTDPAVVYREAARVLARGGLVCTFTESEAIIRRREPLSRYWPASADADLRRYHSIEHLRHLMGDAGLVPARTVEVGAPFEIDDPAPYRDRAYSCLHLISEEQFRLGYAGLERDLARGTLIGRSELLALWGRRA